MLLTKDNKVIILLEHLDVLIKLKIILSKLTTHFSKRAFLQIFRSTNLVSP
ncbi:GSCOCG00005878001-RA-CDS [Cotesia congregata]|nr:GSCOCG00005878001-RA-CDS [Cotesia congregata]